MLDKNKKGSQNLNSKKVRSLSKRKDIFDHEKIKVAINLNLKLI